MNGVDTVDFGMTVSPQDAPDKVEKVSIGFESGVPVSVNGEKCSPLEVVLKLNEIGGRNGVGRIDLVENRFVGMKSRGVYESPGMTGPDSTMLVTVVFTEVEGGTQVQLTHAGIPDMRVEGDFELREIVKGGWTAAFGKLADFLGATV